MEKLIMNVEARSADELVKHKKGPGTRYVFSDHNNNPEGNLYVVVRVVEGVDNPEPHITPHIHEYESMMIFKGANPDMTGLEVEILLGESWHTIQSPRAVRVPPKLSHSCRFVRGSGEYWNIVLTPGADYNRTVR
jgi:2-isopropylmalate synthase